MGIWNQLDIMCGYDWYKINKLMEWWREIMRITLSIIYTWAWALTSKEMRAARVNDQFPYGFGSRKETLRDHPILPGGLEGRSQVASESKDEFPIPGLVRWKLSKAQALQLGYYLHFPSSSLLFPSPFSFTRPCFITYKYFQYDVISYHK